MTVFPNPSVPCDVFLLVFAFFRSLMLSTIHRTHTTHTTRDINNDNAMSTEAVIVQAFTFPEAKVKSSLESTSMSFKNSSPISWAADH